jgi:NTP pyrophosphatase (non-canonical NTP hydrolase)
MCEYEKTFGEIRNERNRQERSWGVQNHQPEHWLCILFEEVGEASAAMLKNQMTQYRTEMVQVAAVAVAAIESFDRQASTKS